MRLRIDPKGYKGKGTQDILGEKDDEPKRTIDRTF